MCRSGSESLLSSLPMTGNIYIKSAGREDTAPNAAQCRLLPAPITKRTAYTTIA